ncbi:MAG: hypothetical protein L0H83_14935, partial [Salinisphaera sp.]|nr:hypothetical protein [Salinisphaera sp.]
AIPAKAGIWLGNAPDSGSPLRGVRNDGRVNGLSWVLYIIKNLFTYVTHCLSPGVALRVRAGSLEYL